MTVVVCVGMLAGCGGTAGPAGSAEQAARLDPIAAGTTMQVTLGESSIQFNDSVVPFPAGVDDLTAVFGAPRIEKTPGPKWVHAWDDYGFYATKDSEAGPLEMIGFVLFEPSGGLLDPKVKFDGTITADGQSLTTAEARTLRQFGFREKQSVLQKDLGRLGVDVHDKNRAYLIAYGLPSALGR